MKRSILTACLTLCLALLALSACALGEAEETGEARTLRLGTSEYRLTVDDSFVEGDLTEEELEDGLVGYFYSEESTLDFDVYQFERAGAPDALAEYVAEEAARYDDVLEIVRDAEINGIPVGWYRTVENYNGQSYDTVTYVLASAEEYVEVVFWMDGDAAMAQADAIIHTLSREAPVELRLGQTRFAVYIPADYRQGEVAEEERAKGLLEYYYSENTLMDFDIYQLEKQDPSESLADFARRESAAYEGVTELVDDGEINGIPAAWYRAVESYDGTDYNTVAYLLDGGDGFVEVLFWLDGDGAEDEAAAIINTLFVPLEPDEDDYR